MNNVDKKFTKLQNSLVVLLQTHFRRFSARRKLKAAWKACVTCAFFMHRHLHFIHTVFRYYISAFYPGAAVKIQAFARRICSRCAVAEAQLRKLQRSQSVFALVIQRVLRGHIHRQLILQMHGSARALQRVFRGHRSRYFSLGKERSQMEAWVNMWMKLVQAGIEGDVASRDVEALTNHTLVKPEAACYFLGGDSGILFDDSFSQLYSLIKKQSVRALHLKIVSLADACLAPSSTVPIARVEALGSFMCDSHPCVFVLCCPQITHAPQNPLRRHHIGTTPCRQQQRQHRRADACPGTPPPLPFSCLVPS
jgi:hypothetical protein